MSEVGRNDALIEHFVLIRGRWDHGQRVVLHVAEALASFHHEPQAIGIVLAQVQAIRSQCTLFKQRAGENLEVTRVRVARGAGDVQRGRRGLVARWRSTTISNS